MSALAALIATGGAEYSAVFNVSANTRATGYSSGLTRVGFSIESLGNDIYRCTDIITATADRTYTSVTFGFNTGVNAQTVGMSGEFMGFQFEAGSIATTYIPTTTAAVSRAADVISASGALVSGLIGQTEGTIYAEVDIRNWIASGCILTCSNGTSNERLIIQVGANRTLQAIVTTASADVANISTASGQVNGVYKCALTYASGAKIGIK